MSIRPAEMWKCDMCGGIEYYCGQGVPRGWFRMTLESVSKSMSRKYELCKLCTDDVEAKIKNGVVECSAPTPT